MRCGPPRCGFAPAAPRPTQCSGRSAAGTMRGGGAGGRGCVARGVRTGRAAGGVGAAVGRVRRGRAAAVEMQRAELARFKAEAGVERTGRLVETSRFSLSRRIGAPVAGPLDEDWFASVASHYGPLEPIDSADTLALAEAEDNVAVAEDRKSVV